MKSHTDIIDETLGVTDMVEIPKPELKAVIPKPSDTTWKLADDGTPCAVEYAIFT